MAKRQDETGTPPTRRADGPPRDMIEFFCPNGHRIRVDASLAGKSGPCSKCGVRVTIPSASTSAESAAKPFEPTPEPSEPAPIFSESLPEPPSEEQDNPLAFDVPLAPTTGMPLTDMPLTDMPLEAPFVEVPTAVAEPSPDVPVPPPAADDLFGVQTTDASADAPWHPSADLVARLWAEREHGGVVEVHHADGVIVPNWYDVTWSRGTHGVFGSQAADGTVTITALAWDAVKKVIVRGVKTLPADMFLG